MANKVSIGVLGGGLAGLSLAFFLNNKAVTIIEKKKEVGGLCRSYCKNDLWYDVGPHIIFSKNERVLKFMKAIIKTRKLRRSNQIFLNGRFIKYPFENFLAMLKDQKKIDYCLDTFLNNSYKHKPVKNMMAFFLKTFGEGITKLYLQPYNRKIWKFNPAKLDTQMVDRIPKPPDQHIIESAQGKFSEGYTHQLHFFYPVKGGFQSIIDAIVGKIQRKGVKIVTGENIISISFENNRWVVLTEGNRYEFDQLVNCMPIHELVKVLKGVPKGILQTTKRLLYNSIYTVIINVNEDSIGENFAIMVPQSNVIFHRISKLDFLGKNYRLKNSKTFLAEITYRQGDKYSQMPRGQLIDQCIKDLVKIGFIKSENVVNFTDFHQENFAYVIYDLNHRQNTDKVLKYLSNRGIKSLGRWAEFEYLNSDQVIEHAMKLAEEINGKS